MSVQNEKFPYAGAIDADELEELVEPMSASTRQKVIGDNVAQVYGI